MGANRKAVDASLKSLADAGRLDDGQKALVQACRSLADAVDGAPDNASLWREYRGALEDLAAFAKVEDDAFAALFDRLRAPVGDGADKPAHARATSRPYRG